MSCSARKFKMGLAKLMKDEVVYFYAVSSVHKSVKENPGSKQISEALFHHEKSSFEHCASSIVADLITVHSSKAFENSLLKGCPEYRFQTAVIIRDAGIVAKKAYKLLDLWIACRALNFSLAFRVRNFVQTK